MPPEIPQWWKELCDDYFTQLQQQWSELTPEGFPPLRYSERGAYWHGNLAGYGRPRFFHVVVARRDPDGRREAGESLVSYLAVGFLVPVEGRPPEATLRALFEKAGIKEPLIYDIQAGPRARNYHAGVHHPDGGDLRRRGDWNRWNRWVADTVQKMRPVVDHIWPC